VCSSRLLLSHHGVRLTVQVNCADARSAAAAAELALLEAGPYWKLVIPNFIAYYLETGILCCSMGSIPY